MTTKSNVKREQAKCLIELEKIIGKPIPQIEEIKWDIFGYKVEGDNIVGLFLFNQGLRTLPESISNLSNLTYLGLRKNNFLTLPESLWDLKSLESLVLLDNQLVTLSESIGNLTSLQYLGLSNNKLTNLPESIKKLTSLERLLVSGNYLRNIQESIEDLKLLQDLYLYDNQLTILPNSIGNLSSLKELNLKNNKLKTLPDSIGNLSSLKKLDLENNQFTSLPESITKLKALESIEMENNNLKTLPEAIGLVKSLKILHLSKNNLTFLPESIGDLSFLQRLSIGYNQLSSLPLSFGRCKNLNYTHLYGNPWDDEWKDITNLDTPAILKFCRGKTPIIIFISHSKDDKNKYNVNGLKKRLKEQEEILDVYSSGENDVSDSHLLLFIATNSSITDIQSRHELVLALTNGIKIIPIKGTDIGFEDLKQIDLNGGGYSYFDLSDKLGFEFDGETEKMDAFCLNLYEYIKQYKRDFDLLNVEERKIDAERENVKSIIGELFESVEFREDLMENLTQLKELSEELKSKQISHGEYLLRLTKILK